MKFLTTILGIATFVMACIFLSPLGAILGLAIFKFITKLSK